jgi:two-component system sensor histidine kinase and response regulator WspE
VTAGRLDTVSRGPAGAQERKRKRVLVVDDSLTVRELERKLIGNHGYDVEVAVDGMDGWNAVRTGHFDLVISDIDMPRMDGIELVTLINKDPILKSMPVMIVSYKDRDEDRERGLNAGAAHYLTKGSFHDATLVQAVIDLIGEP